jgi:DNA-binding MarR family transcriptional regulator
MTSAESTTTSLLDDYTGICKVMKEIEYTLKYNANNMFGLTSAQLLMLASATRNPGSIQSTLHTSAYAGSNSSYNFRRLSETGLIRMEQHTFDKRGQVVWVTAAGAEIAAWVEREMAAILAVHGPRLAHLSTLMVAMHCGDTESSSATPHKLPERLSRKPSVAVAYKGTRDLVG